MLEYRPCGVDTSRRKNPALGDFRSRGRLGGKELIIIFCEKGGVEEIRCHISGKATLEDVQICPVRGCTIRIHSRGEEELHRSKRMNLVWYSRMPVLIGE